MSFQSVARMQQLSCITISRPREREKELNVSGWDSKSVTRLRGEKKQQKEWESFWRHILFFQYSGRKRGRSLLCKWRRLSYPQCSCGTQITWRTEHSRQAMLTSNPWLRLSSKSRWAWLKTSRRPHRIPTNRHACVLRGGDGPKQFKEAVWGENTQW